MKNEIQFERWVIRGESEFARPVKVTESEVRPGEVTLLEEKDLQPFHGTTVMRDEGKITQVKP